MNGDLKRGGFAGIDGKKGPLVFWDNQWHPICGYYFWNNNVAAKLYCNAVGYEFGEVEQKGEWNSTMDHFRIGQCNENDTLLKCTGGCNDYKVGGSCSNDDNAVCKARNPAQFFLKCSGEYNEKQHLLSQCIGNDIVKSLFVCNLENNFRVLYQSILVFILVTTLTMF